MTRKYIVQIWSKTTQAERKPWNSEAEKWNRSKFKCLHNKTLWDEVIVEQHLENYRRKISDFMDSEIEGFRQCRRNFNTFLAARGGGGEEGYFHIRRLGDWT